MRLVDDDGEHDSNDDEYRIVEDRVADHLQRRTVHHRLAEDVGEPLSEQPRRVQRMSGETVDDEKPDGDRRRADHSGVDAFTKEVVLPFSHALSALPFSSRISAENTSIGSIFQ